MQLNPVASTVMVIFYLVTSVVLVAILGFLLYSLVKLNEKLGLLEAKVEPLLVKAEEILTLTNSKIVSLGEHTEGILTHGEAVAEDVHEKVERTAVNVQRTINAPIIGLNSAAAGLAQGLQTFRRLQRKQTEKVAELEVQTQVAPVQLQSLSQPHSENLLASPAVEMAANSNGAPVALRAGRGN